MRPQLFSAVPSGLLVGRAITQDFILGYLQPSLRDSRGVFRSLFSPCHRQNSNKHDFRSMFKGDFIRHGC
jgi:hypothetical protein